MAQEIWRRINKYGYNLTAKDKCTEYGGHLFFSVGEKNDVTGYTVEIAPELGKNGMERRRGNGEGCFWTEWEECDGN